jgi:sugar phosphate isomerase/epimerase
MSLPRVPPAAPRLPKHTMRDFSQDHRWMSINTATVRKQRGQDWPLPQIIDACAARGIRAISPWRDQVAAAGLGNVERQVKALGLELSGYCRGGLFTYTDAASRQAVRDDNRRALDEACTLNAACLVLVVGGLPGALDGRPAHRDIGAARAQVTEGIAALLEDARQRGMPLAIEPLHPMYAADRACINTLAQALDVCDALDPQRSGALGVAVDAYHVWWDPQLHAQIARAGRARLLALHVCDWLVPTTDLLLDRGMMGDGVIDIPLIRSWMERSGYRGPHEVEIFSARDWWKRDPDFVLATCKARHAGC